MKEAGSPSVMGRMGTVKRHLFLPFNDNQISRFAIFRCTSQRQLDFPFRPVPVHAPATIRFPVSHPQPLEAGRSGVSRSAATANAAEPGPQRLASGTAHLLRTRSTGLAHVFGPSSSDARPPFAFF